ncbi:MAG: hypothetical protein QG580_154 [Patescibacteria group bacterium]|nr:hypothetical protein [Patescibacteria group bacterium]
MAQLSWAQTSAPSKEWLKTAKEVVTTSNAWKSINVVSGGISPEMLNDRMWEDVLFAYPSHVQLVALRGDYTLVDKKNVFQFRDTTLNVWVTDLSVPFYIPPGVDVDDPKFLLPIYDGQQRIIKSYAPSGQGQEVLAEAKKSESGDVAKVANVEWVEEDKAFFHEGRLYQKVGDEWKTSDPDAPRAIKAGDRKSDPTFIFSKNAEGEWDPTASNKRNGYKFGMGDYAGYRNNYYRHARNGAPLGGGWYGGPGGAWAPAPMLGGGWNNGWGNSWIGGGLSFGFGWNSGFGCAPFGGGGIVYDPYHWSYWGATPTTRFYPILYSQPHIWQTASAGVVNNYWGDGCMKSAELPAQAQSQEYPPVASQQQVGRGVEPIAQASGKAITLPSSHGGQTSTSSRMPVAVSREGATSLPPSHSAPVAHKPAPAPAITAYRSGGGANTRPVVAENQGARTPVATQQRGGRGQYTQNQAVGRSSNGRPQQPTYVGGGSRSTGGAPVLRTNGGSRPGGQPPAMRGGSANRGGGGQPMMQRGSASRGASVPQRSK